MTKAELTERFKSACRRVTGAEAELTEIDSKFGDADHGITMTKIAAAIEGAVEESQGGIRAMLDDAAMAVMMINGGSAVPLWNTWLDGMQETAPEGEEITWTVTEYPGQGPDYLAVARRENGAFQIAAAAGNGRALVVRYTGHGDLTGYLEELAAMLR